MVDDQAQDLPERLWTRRGPAMAADPYPAYRKLAAHAPVHRAPSSLGEDTWWVVGREAAKALLADQRLARDPRRLPDPDSVTDPIRAIGLGQSMLGVDPPDHTRLRRLVSAAFTVRRISALRPVIDRFAVGLLDQIEHRDRIDLVADFAEPLPSLVICHLLGVPVPDRGDFRRDLRNLLAPGDQAALIGAACASLAAYTRRLVADKRRQPGDDLVTALIAARDTDDRLSEDELAATVLALLVAGHETTTHLLANGTVALLTHPDQLAAVRGDPGLIPAAVEEMLRYDGPTEAAICRWATVDIPVGDQVIPAGAPVMVVLGAANHDGVADPGRFDLRRTPASPHLAFGHGIHYCLGAPLARLEARAAFARLLPRFPHLRLAVPADQLEHRPGVSLRAYESVPVLLHR